MKTILLVVLLVWSSVATYVNIRSILWSILWLERRGKQNRLVKFKQTIPVKDRISMRPLIRYVEIGNQHYKFWIRVKSVFVISQFVLALICLLLFFRDINDFECASVVVVIQSLIWFLIIRFQFDSGWNTKYDLKRRK